MNSLTYGIANKKNRYLIFFLFFLKISAAQSLSEGNNIIVSFSPLALTDLFDGPSVRAGAEIQLYKNISATLEGGYYLRYLKSTKIDPDGYIIRPGLKKYLNGQSGKGKYIALEYQYKNQGFDFRDSIVMDASRFEKQYAIQRVAHSVVFKYGKLIHIGSHFVFEWYCGAGIRHIRSHSDLSPEEEAGILSGEAGDCPIQEDIIRLTGTRIFPDFRAGIKVGYTFY